MRSFVAVLCVVVLAVLASPALASPVLEASGDFSLQRVGDTGTVMLNLTGAENGLSGYNLTLKLSPFGTAEITSVAFSPWAGIPLNGSLPAEKTWIQAIDLDMVVKPGESSVLLAIVTIRATAEGETILTAVPSIVDDDKGGRYTLESIRVPVKVGTVHTETVTHDVASTNMQVTSSSSDDIPSPRTQEGPDDSLSPVVTPVSETNLSATPLLSPSQETTADERTTQPTEKTSGFDCITSCFAGLLICALFLIYKRGGN